MARRKGSHNTKTPAPITERRNPSSAALDTASALDIATLINREDAKVARAVRRVLPQIARGIDLITAALERGGRLLYVGAGTSGRIAALDAVEMAPTFDAGPPLVQFIIAGGEKALASAVESHEDSPELARRDLADRRVNRSIGRKDVVVGISASGRTPYTVAALEFARSKRASTIAVTCNEGSPLAAAGDLAIEVIVGPEVVSGSTRMKAATAEKMVLNMLSTGAMARLGRVYGNLMVALHVANQKLTSRALAILQDATNCSRVEAERALESSGKNLPVALVMLKAGVTKAAARRALRTANNNLRRAIERAMR